MPLDLAAAHAAAGHLKWRRHALVDHATTALYSRHPEWETRWGAAGREMCARDIEHNLRFLETALVLADVRVFERYCAWLARLLHARGVPIDSVAESFEDHDAALRSALPTAAYREVSSMLAAGRAVLADARVGGVPSEPIESEIEDLVRALLAGDRAQAQDILQSALARGHGIEAIGDRVIAPAMREIGRLWHENQITPVEEHLASAIVHGLVARLSPAPEPAVRGRPRAVLACVEGNLHALGLRIVAEALERRGWDVTFLGADVPVRDLITRLREKPAQLVALSLSIPTQAGAAWQLVDALRRTLGERCPRIVVGGAALIEAPALASYIGAESFPDAATLSAVLEAERLDRRASG